MFVPTRHQRMYLDFGCHLAEIYENNSTCITIMPLLYVFYYNAIIERAFRTVYFTSGTTTTHENHKFVNLNKLSFNGEYVQYVHDTQNNSFRFIFSQGKKHIFI